MKILVATDKFKGSLTSFEACNQIADGVRLVNKNAAIMIKDSAALTALVPAVIALSKDESQQQKLIKNISALGVTDADKIIAEAILSSC